MQDTVATTFLAASRAFALCRLRVCMHHSELERIPLTRARVARCTSASVPKIYCPHPMSTLHDPVVLPEGPCATR